MSTLINHDLEVITEHLVSADNKQRLKNLDMGLHLSRSMGVINPRKSAQSVWVGMDVNMPNIVKDKAVKVIDVISDYFATSRQDKNDFWWSSVTGTELDGYEIDEVTLDWSDSNHVKGFIFMPKKDLSAIEACKIMSRELDTYNAWASNNIFDITITTVADSISVCRKGCVNLGNNINDFISELIGELASKVDSSEDAMKCVFSFDAKALHDKDVVKYVAAQLKERFGIVATIGKNSQDDKESMASFVFLSSNVPRLQDVIDLAGERLIVNMRDNMPASDGFSSNDAWALVGLFVNPEPFNNWWPSVQNALIKSMFDRIPYVELKSFGFCHADKNRSKYAARAEDIERSLIAKIYR